MKDILTAITELREQRNWTEYQLAERSGLPQSTISSWFRKGMIPTVPSLEKVCVAFGITLSQLFAEGNEPVALTADQQMPAAQASIQIRFSCRSPRLRELRFSAKKCFELIAVYRMDAALTDLQIQPSRTDHIFAEVHIELWKIS